jgi:uncharacterized membrane protein
MPSTTAFRLSLAVQLITVFALGIMAGFFGTYSANVNLATLQLDGPTYAMVQSGFNRNVRHALFFAFFFGPLPLGLLALATGWRKQRQPVWWWLMAATVLAYALGIVWFTREVNLPLNQLTESWTPATLPADWAVVRDAWNRANLLRAVLSAGLFALGLLSLTLRLLVAAPAMAPAPASAGILRGRGARIGT